MTPRHFILGTAGHVDHGKSALVRALTGTDPDRLPEEKLRGITIDLGFAQLSLAVPSSSTEELSVGIVDVPGHEDFIKNMVAGVGSIDAALLVVAADDGWMPQTEEHLQILTYLGVRGGVVALSKIDLLQSRAEEECAIAAIRARLEGTPFAGAPIVPTSVQTSRGIEDLKSALAAELSRLPGPRDIRKPRLAVDRAFILKGVGTIVTGTLVGGRLARGQAVAVAPAGATAKIRSLQRHNREIETALPGSRAAVNLPDFHPAGRDDGSLSNSTVRRGDVVTLSTSARPTRRVMVLLKRSARAISSMNRDSSPALKAGAAVRFHHATSAVSARLRLFNADAVGPGGRGLALLTLDSPLLIFANDRFILRDLSGRWTLAGGVVLDISPPTSPQRRPNYLEALKQLAEHPDDPAMHLLARLSHSPSILRDEFLAQSSFDDAQIARGIARAIEQRQCTAIDSLLVYAPFWSMLRNVVAAVVNEHHQLHPEQAGLPLADARAALTQAARRAIPKALLPAVNEAIFGDLAALGLARENGTLRSASHRPLLPPRLRAPGEALRKYLAEHPFDPPSRKELAPTDAAQQALRFLIATGQAVQISPEVVLSAQACAEAVEKVRAHLKTHQSATVSQLKTLLASNRRVMVPLLEYLDRTGVTQRRGDLRCLVDRRSGI